jgi:hypothetical protein
MNEPPGNVSQFRSPLWQPKEVLRLTKHRDLDAVSSKAWLVPGILGNGELSCLVGAPGCGKSALATDLAAHVAAGREWFGRRLKRGAVLYVAAEREALVRRRLAALRDDKDLRDLPLAILSGPLDLRTSRDHADSVVVHANALADEARLSIRLIMIDTVSRALAGGDENSPRDMGAFVMNLAAIQAATGAHVCCIHHIPQDGSSRLRGHGSLLGAMDTTLTIEKSSGATRRATIAKNNDGEEGASLAFTMRSVTLWTDPETGENTTAPIIEAAADSPTERSKSCKDKGSKLPKTAQLVLNALYEVVGKNGGAIADPPPDVPPDAKVVTIDQWRELAYQRGITSSTGDRAKVEKAKAAAFGRASTTLLLAKKIGVWEPYVWLAA